MNKAPSIALRIIGVSTIVLSILGLLYNALSLSSIESLKTLPHADNEPYVLGAFLSMLTICTLFFAALFFSGIEFIRLKTRYRYLFMWLLITEVLYFFSISLLWLFPNRMIAISIAAATGIGNGGLMCQFIVFFPLWAPFVVFWAHKRINNNSHSDTMIDVIK